MVEMTEAIGTLGFPIVMVIAFGWYITKKDAERSKVDEEIRERMNNERDKLFNTIEENRKVNTEILTTNRELAESNRIMMNELNVKMNTIENNISAIKHQIDK